MEHNEQFKIFIQAMRDAFEHDDSETINFQQQSAFIRAVDQDLVGLHPELTGSMGFKIAHKRFHELAEIKMDLSLLLYAVSASNTPGEIVMYCSYFCLAGINTYHDLVLTHGNVVPDSLSEAWDVQKIGGSNLLDMYTADALRKLEV